MSAKLKKSKKEGVVSKVVNFVKKVSSPPEREDESNVTNTFSELQLPSELKDFYNDVVVNFPTSSVVNGQSSDLDLINRCVVLIVESEIERYLDVSDTMVVKKVVFESDLDSLTLVSTNSKGLNDYNYKLVYRNVLYGEGMSADTYSKFKMFTTPKESIHNHIDEVRRRFSVNIGSFKDDVSYILTYMRNSVSKS